MVPGDDKVLSVMKRSKSCIFFCLPLLREAGGKGVLWAGRRICPQMLMTLSLVLFPSCSFQPCKSMLLKRNILSSDYNLSKEGVEQVAPRKKNKSQLLFDSASAHSPADGEAGKRCLESSVHLGLLSWSRPPANSPPPKPGQPAPAESQVVLTKLTLNKPWQPGQSYSFITGRIIARPGFVLTNGCAMAEKPASGSH